MNNELPPITAEMRCFFITRTNDHISLVNLFGSKLKKYYKDHDNDKLTNKRIMDPYIILTWNKYSDNCGSSFKIDPTTQNKIDKATLYHVVQNTHHPEFWTKSDLSNFTRDNSLYIPIDVTSMPIPALQEMCCDWCAMAQELNEASPMLWADKTIGTRFGFDKNQKQYIYDTLNFLWSN